MAKPVSILSVSKVTPKPTITPVAPLKPVTVGTILGLGQMYQVQTYNDGVTVTRTVPYATLIGELLPGFNFTPENLTQLSNLTGSEVQILGGANISPANATKILQDSVKADYLLGMKSQESLPVELNTMQTPSLTAEMNYNFYIPEETDLDSQEDQSQDPLLAKEDPPRHVTLTWDVVSTTNPSKDYSPRTPSEATLVAAFTNAPKGIATLTNNNVANSYQNNSGKTQTIQRNGQTLKLTDTHDLETGFNSTSNSRLFKNSALGIINVNNVDLNTINFTDLLLEDL